MRTWIPSKPNSPEEAPDKNAARVILITLAIMFGYWITMDFLGYILSTIIASLLLYRTIGGYKWLKSGIIALMTTAGTEVPLKRPGQPFELAPAYVLLASDDASYISGQIIFVNGGSIAT